MSSQNAGADTPPPDGDADARAPADEVGEAASAPGEPRPQQAAPHQRDLFARAITENATTAIFMMDAEGRTTYMNPAAERLTGFALAEAQGRLLHDTIHHVRPGGRPFPIDECPIHRHVLSCQPLRDHEDVFVRKDGTVYPVRCAASPIVRDGTLAGTVLEVHDLTAQKRAEEALRESEARFRSMADGLPLIVWVHGPDGQQQFVNQTFCTFFGVTREEMSGGRWQLLMHPDDADEYAGKFMACVRDRRPFHAEVRVRRGDGSWRWIESWARPRFSNSGEFLGFVGTSADVTDRKAAEQALRDADRRKDEFLATLSHELRNPLAPIANSLALLERIADPAAADPAAAAARDAGPPDAPAAPAPAHVAAQAAATMRRQLRHLGRLVDDLLDLSRVTRGKIHLRLERFDAVAALRAAADDALPHYGARRHELRLSLPPDPVPIDADPARFAQVVGNLLNNACKYTPEGGRIELSAWRDGPELWVRVKDDGIGIPTEDLPRVFGLFEQVNAGRDLAQGGLGIGLSLVKRLVEMHGGSVTAHSDGPGRGSEFLVCLPVNDGVEPATDDGGSDDDAPDVPASPAAHYGAGDPAVAPPVRRVLVVDDNVDSADSLAGLLAALGHETRVAYDGPEAIAAVERFRPDAVLLDIGLPSMTGHDVCREVRRRLAASADGDGAAGATAARLPVMIALTGWGQEEDRRRSAAAGFDHHLVKPVELDALERLLGGR